MTLFRVTTTSDRVRDAWGPFAAASECKLDVVVLEALGMCWSGVSYVSSWKCLGINRRGLDASRGSSKVNKQSRTNSKVNFTYNLEEAS